jgi:hypothetical protein
MSGCDFVTLRDGLAVPVPVLQRLWSLEERGVTFRLEDGGMQVGPSRLLDDNDRAFLREHRAIVLSILSSEVAAADRRRALC